MDGRVEEVCVFRRKTGHISKDGERYGQDRPTSQRKALSVINACLGVANHKKLTDPCSLVAGGPCTRDWPYARATCHWA